jgi:hypothetical protein
MRGQMTLPAFRELPPERRAEQRALLVTSVGPLGLRDRRTRRIVAVAAAAGLVAVAIALLPSRVADEGRVDVIQRALAAVSTGPVVHAIVENEESHAILVDLESGKETIEPERHEYWYDEERGNVHGRLTIGDEVLREFRAEEKGPPPAHRALAFATHYRQALQTGKARVIRRETIGGRETVLLRIRVPAWSDPRTAKVVEPAYVEEVSVDAETFKPLRFRHLPGPDVVAGPIQWWRVVAIEAIDRGDHDFGRPEPTRVRGVGPSNDRKVTPAEAAGALGRPALWPGTRVGEAELDRIGVMTVTVIWRDLRETKTPALLIRYGKDIPPGSKDWIWISVGMPIADDIPFRGLPSWGPYDGERVPAGTLRLAFLPTRDDRSIDMWFGNVERDGLYINMQSPRRELIVAAAKALKPLE